jgi:hypothetical protein
LARDAGDRWEAAWALHRLAVLGLTRTDQAETPDTPVIPLVEEALSIWRDLGERRQFAFSLCDMGLALAFEGDRVGARKHFRQSLDIFTELEDPHGCIWTLGQFATVLAAEGDFESALWVSAATLSASRARTGVDLSISRFPKVFGEQVERNRMAVRSRAGCERADAIWSDGLAARLEQALEYVRRSRAG